jgi:hypothetical protein
MADLIAIKHITYAGRVIRPGVAFRARPFEARILVAAGHARFSPASDPVPAHETPQITVGRLRTEFETKFGRAPDMRWGVKRLTKEIEAQ